MINLTLEEKVRWSRGVTELRRLRQLEEENLMLKQIVADLSLDKQMLHDVLKKSFKAGSVEGTGQKFNSRLPDLSQACLQSCRNAEGHLSLPATP